MRFASACSGIESASVAWHPLGWEPVWFSEIAPFPCAVLAHHYPQVPNYGDLNGFRSWPDAIFDVLVGGTPCQSFSVAGFRAGLGDPRGNLALVYLEILRRYRSRWFVWENVPGVLSSDRGRDLGSFFGGLAELGYGYAWRTLNARHFGVPQRRPRVFIVGCLGSWARAAAVLLEPESLRGNLAPRRQPRPLHSAAAETSARGSRAPAWRLIPGQDAAGTVSPKWRTASGGPSGAETVGLVAFDAMPARGEGGSTIFLEVDTAASLRAIDPNRTDRGTRLQTPTGIRRFTPLECERLQGFPDHYTAITYRGKPAADAPRYEAIGNAIATPCLRWIGERIEYVDQL